jgi:preprotein translocase subunit SecE
MKKIREYIKECWEELLHKVSWPTWEELQSSTVIVMVAMVIIAFIIFVMDGGFQMIMNFFYKAIS